MNWRRIRRLKGSRAIALIVAGTAVASALHYLLRGHNAPLIIEPGAAFTLLAFLIAGPRIWPAALAGFMIWRLQSSPPLAAFLIASSQTAGAAASAWLLEKTRFNHRLTTLRDYFLLLGMGICGVIVHALLAAPVQLALGAEPPLVVQVLAREWMDETLGLILFLPLLLVWKKLPKWKGWRLAEAILLMAVSIVLTQSALVESLRPSFMPAPRAFPVFLLVTLVGIRLGAHGASLLGVIVFAEALAGAFIGAGAFADDLEATGLLYLWAYTGTICVTGMSLALALQERARSADLHASLETFYRSIVETAQEGIWMIDRHGRTRFCNERMAVMLGTTVQEMDGRSLFEFMGEMMGPEARTRALKSFSEREMGQTARRDFKFVLKDGREVWTIVSTAPIYSKGVFAGAIAMFTDITDRKRAEDRQRMYLETAATGVVVVHANGEIRYANSEAMSILNWRRLEGSYFQDTRWEQVDEAGRAIPPENLPLGRALRLRESVRNYLHAIRDGAGQTKWLLVSAAPILDPSGAMEGALASFVDVTGYRRLLQDAHRLHRIVDQSPMAIMLTDANGLIEYVNPEFERTTGYSAIETLGKTPRILKSGQVPAEVYSSIWKEILAGRSWRGEIVNRHKSGRLFSALESISPVTDTHGRITHFCGAFQDITETKLIEQQLLRSQKMEALGRMSAGMAHDINNLLTMLIGTAELMGTRTDRETLLADAGRILEICRRGSSLTGQLLSFVRGGGSDRQTLTSGELLQRLQSMLQHVFPKSIRIELDVRDPGACVAGDVGLLEQALVNLANNARDAMSSGGVLTIRSRRVPADSISHIAGSKSTSDYVCFEIGDTGSGMTADQLSRAFDPFFTTKPHGSGLGLASVYSIVRGHDGFTHAESTPGAGSSFFVYLPEAAPAERPSPAPPPAAARNLSILHVDDESALREIFYEFFEQRGHRVLSAQDGLEALELAQNNAVDVVVSDLDMPLMDGAELFQALRSKGIQVPFVLCTGYVNDPHLKKLQEAGLNFLLSKPFTLEEAERLLLQAVSR